MDGGICHIRRGTIWVLPKRGPKLAKHRFSDSQRRQGAVSVSNNTDIYNAFAAIVGTYAASKSLPVAWPGINFTPPATGAWLEVAWFPNQTMDKGFGNDF